MAHFRITSSTPIPTYVEVLLKKSWNNWHAGVEPERLFDDFLQVFHLVQVSKCGSAVRTFKYPLQLFICLVLEEDSIQSSRSNDRIIDVIPSEDKNPDWFGNSFYSFRLDRLYVLNKSVDILLAFDSKCVQTLVVYGASFLSIFR